MAHPTNKATDDLDVGGHTSTQVGARLSLQHKFVAFFPLSLSKKLICDSPLPPGMSSVHVPSPHRWRSIHLIHRQNSHYPGSDDYHPILKRSRASLSSDGRPVKRSSLATAHTSAPTAAWSAPAELAGWVKNAPPTVHKPKLDVATRDTYDDMLIDPSRPVPDPYLRGSGSQPGRLSPQPKHQNPEGMPSLHCCIRLKRLLYLLFAITSHVFRHVSVQSE